MVERSARHTLLSRSSSSSSGVNERSGTRMWWWSSSSSSSTKGLVFWLLVLAFSFNLVALVKQGWLVVRLNWIGAAQDQSLFGKTEQNFRHGERLKVYTVTHSSGGVKLFKIPPPPPPPFSSTSSSSEETASSSSEEEEEETASQEQEMQEQKDCTLSNIGLGEFVGDSFSFTGPCAASGASKWYSTKNEACSVLDRFDVYIIGQSTERRVYYGLQALAGGNEWAFKNGIPDVGPQQLPDQKGLLKNLSKRPIPCFHVTLQFETSFNGITKAIEKFVAKPQKYKNKRKVIMFQFGLYGLADNNFHPSQLSKQMDQFLTTSGVAETARRNGDILMWRPPVPVNATHKRFRRYTGNGKDANWSLDRFRGMSNEVASQHKLCIFDSFPALMSGVETGAVKFETGEEWTPAQFGGIHLKDNGRKLVCQVFLNTVNYCASSSSLE